MRKTETLRQLSAVANAKYVEHMSAQLETLRQAQVQSAEELASLLEPLAQAMAALTDETRVTLTELQQQSTMQVQALEAQSQALLHQWERNPQELQAAAQRLTAATDRLIQNSAQILHQATWRLGWKHYALTVVTGLVAAVLTLGLWTWLSAKPVTSTPLSKPSVTAPSKPSNGNSKPLG
jgi:glutamate-1-semialdehyde aminotransferase